MNIERALSLLGSGVSAEATAAALGVSASRISQLLADEEFANKVAEIKYKKLKSYTERDNKYDEIEDRLLDKLTRSIPLIIKPRDILQSLKVINDAKRRGQQEIEPAVQVNQLVSIVLPQAITENFTVNINNQVIKAGNQELLTIPSGNLLKRHEQQQEKIGESFEKEKTADDN